MAGFMKNAMSYLGMSDVAEGEDDFEDDVDTGETSIIPSPRCLPLRLPLPRRPLRVSSPTRSRGVE